MQARSWNSFSPAATGVSDGRAAGQPRLVVRRLHRDDLPIMPECFVPQYSAQKRW